MPSEKIPANGIRKVPRRPPYDPPEPAPQAAAWRRALRVIGCIPPKGVPHGQDHGR